MSRCSSQVELLQYAAGELTGGRRDQVASHLKSCGTCRARLSGIRQDFEEFEDRKEAGLIKLQRQMQQESSRPQKARRSLWFCLVPAAGLAVLAGLILWLSLPVPQEEGGVRAKGLMTMEIIANRQGVQFQVQPGQNLQPLDRLRFRLKATRPVYFTIVSIDQNGVFSSYYPASPSGIGGKPLKIEKAGVRELPGAIELDETPGRERIILLCSSDEFNLQRLNQTLKKLLQDHPDQAPRPAELGFAGELIVFDVNKSSPKDQ